MLSGSGTYPPASPRLKADITKEIDPQAYNLGKLIYAGRAKLAGAKLSNEEVAENLKILSGVMALIPERAQAKLDIDQLSGQLNNAEENALIYYLRLRFRVAEVDE